MIRPLLALGVVCGLSFFSPSPALAASCSVSTTSVSFGSYDVFSTIALDITGSITFNCDAALSISIALNQGGSATFVPRRLIKGADALNYNLYLDGAKSAIWGDGTGGTSVYMNPSTPANQNVTITIFGTIPARQNVKVGSYNDTITATINF